jgi:quinone-modifying oxidoreductase subunit QmoC
MAEAATILPSADVRKELTRRGAESLGRCYQCATCASVCELSTPEIPFPRQQMLLAQWGMIDRLVGDPAIWLCHQCTDCSERCPRDAKPGNVLQSLRSTVIRKLAFPGFAGKLVGNARVTWPLMILAPLAFWLVVMLALGSLPVNTEQLLERSEHGGYAAIVPHWVLYAVFFPIAGWVTLAAAISGRRLWNAMGQGVERKKSFMTGLVEVVTDVLFHQSFGSCKTVRTRRWGHLFLFWGFVGAAVTSGLLVVGIYVLHDPIPYPQWHPFKILGNLSAVALVVGGVLMMATRFGSQRPVIKTTAFDAFFIFVVAGVIVTGVITEVVRLGEMPMFAFVIYTLHLGVVTTLFLTFPYSKFAHMVFRTLALAHQRTVTAKVAESRDAVPSVQPTVG